MPILSRLGKNRLLEERNGPTSLPEGLMVPKIAANTKRIGFSLTAKIQPASAISIAPKISSALRPKLSATAVIKTVITAPPARAAVKTQPMAVVLNPTASR